MKKLLIILLIFPIAVYSQNEPAKPKRKFTDRIVHLETSGRPSIFNPIGTLQIGDDTVKVIMLVGDTTKNSIYTTDYHNIIVPEYDSTALKTAYYKQDTSFYYTLETYWMFGFKVISYSSSPYYLNARKEKLPKEIIVWDSKERKP